MTEKRFTVAVYDDKAINGFAVLDLQKPNSSKRLKYENVYIGSKAGCEIVCNFGNSLADENEQLKRQIGNLEHTRDFCAEVCADCERLKKENEELKQSVWSWSNSYNKVYQENQQLKNLIQHTYQIERTELGRSVLKQLLEEIE